MDCRKQTLFINSFAAWATNGDVLKFLHPFKPMSIRLVNKKDDPRRSRQVAFVNFADEATIKAVIAQKDDTHFMGEFMRVKTATPNRHFTSNRPAQENGGNDKSRNQPPSNGFLRKPLEKKRSTEAPAETRKGTFQIVALGHGNQLVALETGWRADQRKLADDLQEYADFIACGVDEMEPEVVYACKDDVTPTWQRCRKISETGGVVSVELIDQGRQRTVRKDEVLELSSLYKCWTVKAVDLDIVGFEVASTSMGSLEAHVLEKTYDLSYECQRRGSLMRDRLRVSEMKLNGKSVLDDLVAVGILLRK